MSAREFDEVISVGLRGVFLCTREAARAMQDTGGHIVQIVSASGFSGFYGQANYAAAKEGIMGILRTAVLELEKFNIRCNAFWPVAQTDMTQVIFDHARSRAKDGGIQPADMGFGTPEEVAEGILWLLSEDAAHLNGQCLSFNGRRISLWRHPAEAEIKFYEQAASFAEISTYMQTAAPQPIYAPSMVQQPT